MKVKCMSCNGQGYTQPDLILCSMCLGTGYTRKRNDAMDRGHVKFIMVIISILLLVGVLFSAESKTKLLFIALYFYIVASFVLIKTSVWKFFAWFRSLIFPD